MSAEADVMTALYNVCGRVPEKALDVENVRALRQKLNEWLIQHDPMGEVADRVQKHVYPEPLTFRKS